MTTTTNIIDEQAPPLMRRLARELDARWVDADSVTAWSAEPGDRVLLLAGDPVRFPEGQDVAAVLPELHKACAARFAVAVVPREQEDAVARRYGSQRWPSLLFFRDGQYVTAIAGMHDWDVFVKGVDAALRMPPSRPPTIGIPVVDARRSDGCH
ncbi:MAG: hydrogenase [Hydrogenophaga sp.]|uniref:hydrogenase n=1 Tax=Hydrogenophaga sp. TaxID=1904254 RepID=UPI001D6FB080|nr:hydrogenase [Hydrogenophaga sp.]MBX3609047.1 hydrogenase [Hydrogenophaga sp.]